MWAPESLYGCDIMGIHQVVSVTGGGWSMYVEDLHCHHGHTFEIYGITKEANECISLRSLSSLNVDLTLCRFSVCLCSWSPPDPKNWNLFQLREVYNMAICCDISESPQFRECFQLLGFQSREELLDKLGKVLGFLESASSNVSVKVSHLKDVHQELSKYYTSIVNMGIEATEQPLKSPSKIDIGENINRYQLKEVNTGYLSNLVWYFHWKSLKCPYSTIVKDILNDIYASSIEMKSGIQEGRVLPPRPLCSLPTTSQNREVL